MPKVPDNDLKLYRLARAIHTLSEHLLYFSTGNSDPDVDFPLPDSEEVLEYIKKQLEEMKAARDANSE